MLVLLKKSSCSFISKEHASLLCMSESTLYVESAGKSVVENYNVIWAMRNEKKQRNIVFNGMLSCVTTEYRLSCSEDNMKSMASLLNELYLSNTCKYLI